MAKERCLTVLQTLDNMVVETSAIVTLVRKSLASTGVGMGKIDIRTRHLSENSHIAYFYVYLL